MFTAYGIFDCDNGYTCSCCGEYWTEVEEKEFSMDEQEETIIEYFKSLTNSEKVLDKIIIPIKVINVS